jgi:hypothetical protein
MGQVVPELVSEMVMDDSSGAPQEIFSLSVTKQNNYIAICRNSYFEEWKSIYSFNSNGLKNWKKNYLDSLPSMTRGLIYNNIIDLNNEDRFLVATKKTISKYSQQGELLKKVDVPTNWIGTLNIKKNSNNYFVGDQIGLIDHTNLSQVYVYNNDLTLNRSFSIELAEDYNVWAVNESNLYTANYIQAGYGSTNVVKYDLNGNKIWSKSYLNHQNGQICLQGANMYYAARVYSYNFPTALWYIEKMDTSGNKIWSTTWDGDYSPINYIEMYVSDIVELPTGGCIVIGSSTASGQDMNDPGYSPGWIEPIAIAFGNQGEILWKIRTNIIRAQYTISWLGVGKWDKENYLLLAGFVNDYKSSRIWKYKIDGVTAVKTEKPNIPQDFSLSQNYPNPFNPSTTISFSVPKDGFVTLKIYDLFGRVVSIPINEELKAGMYNQKVSAGQLASGTYFYRISVDNYSFSATKKMTVLK